MSDQLSSDLAALRIERAAPPPKSGLFGKLLVAAVVIGAGVGGYMLLMPYLRAQVMKAEVEVTEIASVSPAQATIELTSTGYVVAQSVAKVSPKLPGKVLKAYVKEGQQVKAGD